MERLYRRLGDMREFDRSLLYIRSLHCRRLDMGVSHCRVLDLQRADRSVLELAGTN